MKLTNKILEAVNRGIKFALDDYEDQEDIQGQSNSKVNHQDGTKEYLDLMNKVELILDYHLELYGANTIQDVIMNY